MFQQSSVVIRFGEDLAPSISIKGDGFDGLRKGQKGNIHSGSLPLKGGAVDLSPEDNFPVNTKCSCLRSATSDLNTKSRRASSLERRLSDRFFSSHWGESHVVTDDEEDEEDELQLTSLIKTLQRFSGKHLTPLQAKNVSRLAKSCSGKETLTASCANHIKEFLESDSPGIQEATLITLSRLIEKGEGNVYLLLNEYSAIWDEILSLVSDAPTVEVQLAAMKAIEKVTSFHENLSEWEGPLEDIVYPLIHAIIKNQESSFAQKVGSLGIMRNLSTIPTFAACVKQDVLSPLLSARDNSQINGIYLLVLYENLKSSKQRISTDILDNSLLPVLVSMLQEGSCNTQLQALNLLQCFVEDEVSRASLFSTSHTVAYILTCAKCTKCRKVRALCLSITEQLLSTRNVVQARQLMECNSESLTFHEQPRSRSKYIPKEDKVSSVIRQKSRAEAELWLNFDSLIVDLVGLLEREGCIYEGNNRLVCGLSLIGSINSSQLTCVSSLIGCFNKLCLWPIQRPRKHGGVSNNLDNLPESNDLCDKITSSLNRHHALEVWTKVGHHVMAIYRQIVKRIPSTASSKENLLNINNSSSENLIDNAPSKLSSGNRSTVNLDSLLKPEEYLLFKRLNEFVLIMSTASCSFQNLSHGVRENESDHNKGNKENTLTKRSKMEQLEREELTDRKNLRCGLINEGVVSIVKDLLAQKDSVIQTVSITTLRMCIQPLVNKDKSAKDDLYVHREIKKSRPQSATARLESSSRQTLNQRVFQMGRPGTGSRPQSAIPYLTNRSRPASARPSVSTPRPQQSYILSDGRSSQSSSHVGAFRPRSAQFGTFHPLTPRSEPKQLYHRSGEPAICQRNIAKSRPHSAKSGKNVTFDKNERVVREFYSPWQEQDLTTELNLSLLSKGDIGAQCCHQAFLVAGETALTSISSKDKNVRRSSLLFLHDLVKFGTHEIHMDLSKLGCIPKLVNFLRINDEDELLEVTGLTIARMMVSSDRRICQLFNRHGGTNVLMALLKKYQGTPLKDEVCSTLNAVNNTMHQGSSEDVESRKAGDAWEHIMQRWNTEDEVVAVLKQFL